MGRYVCIYLRDLIREAAYSTEPFASTKFTNGRCFDQFRSLQSCLQKTPLKICREDIIELKPNLQGIA